MSDQTTIRIDGPSTSERAVINPTAIAFLGLTPGTDGQVLSVNEDGQPEWVTDGGGGGATALAECAWIEPAGNDVTGVVGDITHPYQTMQAAYDDGARTFYLGVGTFAGLTNINAEGSLRISGHGIANTIVTNITVESASSGNTCRIQDLGDKSVFVTNLISTTPDAAAGTGGGNGDNSEPNHGHLKLYNLYVENCTQTAGLAGTGDGSGTGGNGGGLSGSFYALGCFFVNVTVTGGTGGQGGPSDGNGGDGGSGSTNADLQNCNVTYYTFGAGSQGSQGGAGAPGNLGSGGATSVFFSDIASATFRRTEDIYNSRFSFIGATGLGTAGTINASKINGTWTA